MPFFSAEAVTTVNTYDIIDWDGLSSNIIERLLSAAASEGSNDDLTVWWDGWREPSIWRGLHQNLHAGPRQCRDRHDKSEGVGMTPATGRMLRDA